jgi:hypothetical protein
MFFLSRLSRSPRTKSDSSQRRRIFRPQLEQLHSRLVLSGLSSAISIPHNGWTERDWYTVDATGVVEFQGTHRVNLGSPNDGLRALSASVDPNTGSGEVFAITFDTENPFLNSLSLCDSHGTWHYLGRYGNISATHDGHVYATTDTIVPTDIQYLDSSGNAIDLGAPNTQNGTGLQYGHNTFAASVGWFGWNEVFAIGKDGYIYVNSLNTPGGWRLVDKNASFTSLSATPNDTVFATTTDGRLIQETEHSQIVGWYVIFYFTGQDISGGSRWSQISADTDASGHDEVYAIMNGANQLYQYDQGSWTWKDSDVYDVSGASGGYFYDVNYANGNYNGWFYNPNGGTWFAWNYLGSGLG